MTMDAMIERVALATELPVGTVARVAQALYRNANGQAAAPTFDLVAFLEELTAWQAETFGPRQTIAGVIDHIRKELAEIERRPRDLLEWIDLLNLVISGMTKADALPMQICGLWLVKFQTLQARTWPDWRSQDPDRAIEHDRSAEAPATPAGKPDGLADFGLLVSFPDQSPSFVHGFEAGMIWHDLRMSADPFEIVLHTANRELALRMAAHHGWTVAFRPTPFEEWISCSFERGSRPALTSIDGGRAG